jgi:hypothetical protein
MSVDADGLTVIIDVMVSVAGALELEKLATSQDM